MQIERMHLKSYGCVKDAELQLTALHAFVGPNDAGKSMLFGQSAHAGRDLGATRSA